MDQGTEAMDAHTIDHIKGDVILGFGLKSKTRNNETPMRQRIERRQFTRVAKTIQEDVHTHAKFISQQGLIFQETTRRRNTG